MSGLEDLFKGIINRAKQADGKVVGENSEIVEEKMAKDEKGAWVNRLSEQYLKKEELDTPPAELNIEQQDIISEIAKREINKILGK